MWESHLRLKPNSKGNKPFFASTPQLCKSRGPVKRAGCYNLTLFRWYKRSLPVYWDLSTEKRMTLLSYIRGLVFASGIACYLTEKVMVPHSSTLAWKIPWTEEPGRLQSMGSLWVGHDWATSLSLFTFMHWRRKWQPTPVFLPGEYQGWGSLVGCRLWDSTESDTTEAT